MREAATQAAQYLADFLMNLPSYPGGETHSNKPKIVAHRGAWSAREHPENTILAFERARQMGAWAVEFDLHFTKDHVPVIMHDPDLWRTHRSRSLIKELTHFELKNVAPAVPQLKDVLKLTNMHFMIEVKTSLTKEHHSILEEHLQSFAPVRDYHILTLDVEKVQLTPACPPEAWILVGDVNARTLIEKTIELDLGGAACHYLTMTKAGIDRLHKHGKKAGVGFIPTHNLYKREWQRGIDWVFTNQLSALTQSETP